MFKQVGATLRTCVEVSCSTPLHPLHDRGPELSSVGHDLLPAPCGVGHCHDAAARAYRETWRLTWLYVSRLFITVDSKTWALLSHSGRSWNPKFLFEGTVAEWTNT